MSDEAMIPADQRAHLDRQVEALGGAEIDDEGSPAWRAEVIAAIDRRRAAHGNAPLAPWWATKGEPELHERARALGLLRRVR